MAIINLLQLQPGEKITTMVHFADFDEDRNLIMATKKGTIKKTPLSAYMNIRKTGIQAITLRDDDELIEVKVSDCEQNVLMLTKKGQAIKFAEKEKAKFRLHFATLSELLYVPWATPQTT